MSNAKTARRSAETTVRLGVNHGQRWAPCATRLLSTKTQLNTAQTKPMAPQTPCWVRNAVPADSHQAYWNGLLSVTAHKATAFTGAAAAWSRTLAVSQAR